MTDQTPPVEPGAVPDQDLTYVTLMMRYADSPRPEERAAVWRHVCELVEAAYREGYDDGCDPAWCEKQLRRAGVKAEAHEAAATDYFWQRYRTALSGAAATEAEAHDE